MPKDNEKQPKNEEHKGVVPRSITTEMRESYLDYAMSVITARALPDVRDGLKPVHRRILFSMHELGLTANVRFRKSATVVGDVLGKYHPHGDVAVYDSMVKLSQGFATRYPLIIGQGNWGSLDGDAAAAMRYCITGDSLVATDNGLVPINEISEKKSEDISIKILSKDKKINKASKWFDSGEHPTKKIVTGRGYSITGSLNHPLLVWRTNSLGRPSFAWKLLGDIKEGDTLVIDRTPDILWPKDFKLNKFAPSIREKRTEIKKLPNTLDEDLAFVMGALIAEGSIREKEIEFCNSDREFLNEFSSRWARAFPDCRLHNFKRKPSSYGKKPYETFEIHSKLVVEFLKNIGLHPIKAAEKNIPFTVLRSSRKSVAAFIRAYFEGDGSVSFVNKMNELSAVSKSTTLLRELQILLLRFGIVSTLRFDKHRHIHKLYIRGLENYRIFEREIGFVSERKKEKLKSMIAHLSKEFSITDFVPLLSKYVRAEVVNESDATRRFIWRNNFDRYPLMMKNGDNITSLIDEQNVKSNIENLFSELLSSHYYFDSVKEISDGGVQKVYSLKVESKCHSFVANGFVNHNTEAKMSRMASELLRDIEKDTVDFRPNYDGTRKEPTVLPAAVPNLLLNGTLGIAVGMATNIPPHNLKEVLDALVYLIENKDATTEDLLQFIKGPDFPTGAVIYGEKDLHHAYATGRGGVAVRGEAEIVEDKKGQFQIVITSIPYRVNKAELIERIADLVREKQIDGIKGLRDESAKDIRIAIDLKSGAHPQKVLNFLYKHTQLEETFHFNVVALVDGVPKTLSLKSLLEEFLKFRTIVIRRRTQFDLAKAEDREHILLGLKKALDYIDRIIKLIRGSRTVEEAHVGLMKEFKFSDKQATAILEMRLQKLAGLERKKIEDELGEVQDLITKLKDLLANPKKILGVIKDESKEIAAKYGDERRTRVIKHGVKAISDEDLIPDEESVLVYTAGGYVKRTDPEEYRKQRRGGVGVVDLDTKEEDFVTKFVTATTHSELLFFTDKGKAYQIKMYDIPEGKRATKGKSIMNFLSLTEGEKVTSILPMPKTVKAMEGVSLMMVTKNGVAKKVAAKSFHDVRRSGLIAITLKDNDELVAVSFCGKGDEVILATSQGQSIRFKESDVREMGRSAAGVSGMRLGKGDFIINADVVKKDVKDAWLLVISANGYGKKTELGEYKVQKRAGSGIITMNTTAKTGDLIGAKVVTAEDEELVAISKKSQVIRVDIKEISTLGRSTQGVRIMKLREGDSIASMICL